MKPITRLLTIGLLLLAYTLSGQMTTTFTPQNISPAKGASFVLELKVTGFTSISSLQFPITYAQSVLRFDSLSAAILPGFNPSNYTILNNLGQVRVSWFPDQAQYPNGYTVSDNTALFKLHFTVIEDGTTTVNIKGVPGSPVEVVKAGGQNVTVNTSAGASTVKGGAGGSVNPPLPPGLHVIANTIYIPAGGTGCMPVTVYDFDKIITLVYAMRWDPLVLEYTGVQAFNLTGLSSSNFSSVRASEGYLALAWDDVTFSGVDRPDHAKIYEVCFKAKGAIGASSIVTFGAEGFSNETTEPEAYNASSVNKWDPNASPIADTLFIVGPTNPITFIADKDTVPQTQPTCVDIRVKNFTDVTKAKFGISYDATKFEIAATPITLGSNPLGLSMSNFTTTTPGEVRFDWSGNKATIADNSSVFSVCLKATGAVGSSAALTLGALTGYAVDIQKSGAAYANAFTNGSILIGPPPTISAAAATVQNVSCPNGNNGSINLTVTGCSGTANYSWTGPNGFTSNLQNPTGLRAGAYNVTVTCSNGVTATSAATVNGPVAFSNTAPTVNNIACPGGSNGSISIAVSGGTGAYTYKWSNNATTASLTGIGAGSYTLTVTDANGCTYVPQNQMTVSAPPAFALNGNVNQPSCGGTSDGGISLTISGGTSPYKYDWSHNGTQSSNPNDPKDLGGLPAGNYTVTVYDNNGCTTTSPSYALTNPPAVSVMLAKATNIKCKGSNTGEITVNAGGGTGTTYTYSWINNISNTNTATGLAAGTYSVTVSDSKGCTGKLTQDVTITEPATALQVSATAMNAVCPGGTGSLTTSVSGGWNTNYSFNWSGNLPATQNPSNVPPGNYTVTVTDAQGCALTTTASVVAPPEINAGTPVVSNVLCFGTATGNIKITPTGGNGGFSVGWTLDGDPGFNGNGAEIGNLKAGTYNGTISDAFGCTFVITPIEITQNPALQVSETIVKPTTTGNGSISIAPSGGKGPYSYNWTGPNGASGTTQPITVATPGGDYSVTTTDAVGCSVVETYTAIADDIWGLIAVSATGSCGANGCINFQLPQTVVPPFTITWTGGSTVVNTRTVDICDFKWGDYTLTVTDKNGNSKTLDKVTVIKLDLPIVGSDLFMPVDGQNNGSISLMPIPSTLPLQYQWSTGGSTSNITGLDAGIYYVTITHNVSKCTAIDTFILKYPDLLIMTSSSASQPTCIGANNGSITLNLQGGDLPFQIKWSGPNNFSNTASVNTYTQTLTKLAPGQYSVTVTGADNVSKTWATSLTNQSNLIITNVSELSSYGGGYQVSGPGACDGRAKVFHEGQFGPVFYDWSNGALTAETNSLCGGTYSVTVTDQLGCSSVWSDSLSTPPAVSAEFGLVNYNGYAVSCNGKCDGEATVQIVGGIPPYRVQWPSGKTDILSTGVVSKDVNLCAGEYAVTITDNNGKGQPVTQLFTINEPEPIEPKFAFIAPSSFNTCDGDIIFEPEGAVGLLRFSWVSSNGNTGNIARAENLCAGETVSFKLIDGNGCTIEADTTMPIPPDGCFQISPVMTPGEQDGKNDELRISCIEQIPVNTLEVFNRWGQLVYEASPYDQSNPWTATNKSGEPLPEGVYYFVFTYTSADGKAVQYKGHINVLR